MPHRPDTFQSPQLPYETAHQLTMPPHNHAQTLGSPFLLYDPAKYCTGSTAELLSRPQTLVSQVSIVSQTLVNDFCAGTHSVTEGWQLVHFKNVWDNNAHASTKLERVIPKTYCIRSMSNLFKHSLSMVTTQQAVLCYLQLWTPVLQCCSDSFREAH